jgi:ribosomal protein S18 acetylase RimI-like enzyme
MGLEKIRWEHGELVVARARKVDAVSILSIHREVLAEGDFFITTPEEFHLDADSQIERISRFLDSTDALFLVARVHRVPVGFLTLQPGPLARMTHCAKLEIMVAKRSRAQGIGRKLLSAAMEWAVAHPIITKVGLSVFAENQSAAKLYREFGFVEEGRRIKEYRLEDGSYRDDVLMGCWVGA